MSSRSEPADRERQNQGVDASNQQFRRYEQVDKPQDYRLSESDELEAFDDNFEIRTIDMSAYFAGGAAGRLAFAEQLGRAMEDVGFVVLTGHGVDPQVHVDGTAQTISLFEGTTRAQRLPFLASRHGSVNQGYFPIRETSIIHPDLVEGWVFCRRAFNMNLDTSFDASEFWPRTGDEPVFRRLCQSHERLILPLMQSMLRYLGCDPHLYDEKLTGTNFGFRINYYPPPDDIDGASRGGRMLGHEDVDLFTLLPAPSEEGLQVLNRRNMKWVRLTPPPGSIIVNTGDYMQRISNDRFPSTTHRVARPRKPSGRPRVSMPMAVYVWEDEVLEVLPGLGTPRYPPIRAVEFHTAITSKYYGDDYAVGKASSDPNVAE